MSKKEIIYRKAELIWGDPDSLLVVDEDGKLWQLFKKRTEKYSFWNCWRKGQICDFARRHGGMTRPHLTCVWCRLRTNPQKPVEVLPYIILLRKKRNQIKRFLTKKILSLAEALS